MVDKLKKGYDSIKSWLIPVIVSVFVSILTLAVVFGKSLNQIETSKQDINKLYESKADKEVVKIFIDEIRQSRIENREDHKKLEDEIKSIGK